MNHNLTPKSRTYQASISVAAGVDGAFVALPEIDMKGYAGVRIIFCLGAIAAGGVITTRVKNSDTTATYGAGTIDRVGSNLANDADTDDNKIIIHEIYKPRRRFLQPEYQRTVGNVTITSVIYELLHPINALVSQATADVEASQVLNNPEPSAT